MPLRHVVHRHVHALEHGGQHGAGLDVVLVAVHANGQLAAVLGRLVNADASAAGSRKNHVRALGKLRLGQLTATGRVVPGSAGGAGHVGKHLGLGVRPLGALLVAALEAANQRDVHAAHKTDLTGLAGHGRHRAHQEAALVLFEDQRLHIGQLDLVVDDGKVEFRELLGDFLHARSHAEGHSDDGAGALLGHAAQGLLALRLIGDLKLEVLFAGLFLPLFHAVVGGFVERLVKFATHVEHDRWFGRGREARSQGCGQDSQTGIHHQFHGGSLSKVGGHHQGKKSGAGCLRFNIDGRGRA